MPTVELTSGALATILTFFPSHEAETHVRGFVSLYDSIITKYQFNSSSLGQMDGVLSLYSLIFESSMAYFFQQEQYCSIKLINTYRWVVGLKVECNCSLLAISYLKYRSQADKDVALQAAEYSNRFNMFANHIQLGDNDSDDDAMLSYKDEMKLTLDTADIVEELKMITHLIDNQISVVESSKSVLEEIQSNHGAPAGTTPITSAHSQYHPLITDKLVSIKSDMEIISRDAQRTNDMVCAVSPCCLPAFRLGTQNAFVGARETILTQWLLLAPRPSRPETEDRRSIGSSIDRPARQSFNAVYYCDRHLCTMLADPSTLIIASTF